MSLTTEELEGFREWLARRGRSETTQAQYVRQLRRLSELEDLKAPLLDRKSSACYRHAQATVLRQWAKYSKDAELLGALEEIKLPFARRKSIRTPIVEEEWFGIISELEKAENIPAAIKAVMQIIMTRGIRCSDVLRLEKSDIRNALKTGILSYTAKGERRIEYSAVPIRAPLEVLGRLRGGRVWEMVSKGTLDSAARKIRSSIAEFSASLGYDPGELFSHRFRHTFVNRFLEEMQGDPRAAWFLQDAMGWASPNTARSYVANASREELQEIEAKLYSRRK